MCSMINKLILILIGIIVLLFYTLFIQESPKKEVLPALTTQAEIHNQEIVPLEENKSTPMALSSTKIEKKTVSHKVIEPKIKAGVKTPNKAPEIDLKYYNLSVEKDYSKHYNNDNQMGLEKKVPPLRNIRSEEKTDINLNLTPEFNYNKQTKELTIDGVQIQLEKKF